MSQLSPSPDKSSPSSMGSPGPSRSFFSPGTTPTTETDVDPSGGLDFFVAVPGVSKPRSHLRPPESRRRIRGASSDRLSGVSDQEPVPSDEDNTPHSLSHRLDRLIHLSADLLAVSRYATGISPQSPGNPSPSKDPPYVHRRLLSQTSNNSAKGNPTTASAPTDAPVPEQATPSKKPADVGQLLKAAMEDNVLDDESEGSFFDVRGRSGGSSTNNGKMSAGSAILHPSQELGIRDAWDSARRELVRPPISPINIKSASQTPGHSEDGSNTPERRQRWSLPFGIRSGRTVSKSNLSLKSDTKATQVDPRLESTTQAEPRSPISPRSSFNSAKSTRNAPSTPTGRSEATQAASPTLATRSSYLAMQHGKTDATAPAADEAQAQEAKPGEDSPAKASIVDLLRSFGSKVGTGD